MYPRNTLQGTIPLLATRGVSKQFGGTQALIDAGIEVGAGEIVAASMPAAFLDDLKEAVETFEEATHAREAGKNEQAAARTSIRAALSSGLAAARSTGPTGSLPKGEPTGAVANRSAALDRHALQRRGRFQMRYSRTAGDTLSRHQQSGEAVRSRAR